MAELRRIFAIALKQGSTSLLGVLLIIVLAQLLTLAPSLFIGRTIDFLIDGQFPLVWWALAILLTLSFVKLVFSPWYASVVARFVQGAVFKFSQDCVRVIFHKQYRLFESGNVGGVIKRSERGIEGVEGFLVFVIASSLPAIASLTIVTAYLSLIAGWQILVLLVVASFVFIVVSNWIIRWRRPFIDSVNDAEDDLAETYADSFLGAKPVKAAGSVDEVLRGLGVVFETYAAKATKLAFASGLLTSTQEFIATATVIAAIAIGTVIILQADANLSVGEFVIIFSFVTSFMVSVGQLMELRKRLDQYNADMTELDGLLALPPIRSLSANRRKLQGTLMVRPFDNFTEASLTLRAPLRIGVGEHILVSGETGSGKSTFVEIAAAFNDTHNIAFVGETDLATVDYSCITRHIFYSPQKPVFLEGDFRRSILFGQTVERQKLIRLMQAVGLSKFNAFLDARTFDTSQLSGGERKRFALLRALCADQAVIILDEPTSEIDEKVAKDVWQTIFKELANKTLICASHDLGQKHRFDRTVNVSNGVIELGSVDSPVSATHR